MNILGNIFNIEEINIKKSEFILLNLSQAMIVNNNQAVTLNPFQFDTVVSGSLPDWDFTNFKYDVPKDGMYLMQAAYRVLEPASPVGTRCAEIIVDGTSATPGTIAELKVIAPSANNFYALNSFVFLETGQKVEFGIRQTSGATQSYTVLGTYAFIYRLGNVI